MAENAPAEVLSFPTDISTFDEDERISFSKLDGKYIAVQEDGTEFEFDRTLKRWIPLTDDEADAQIAAAQAAYGGSNAGEENHDLARPGGNSYGKNGNNNGGGGARQGKKRKQDQAYGREPSDPNSNKQNKRGNPGAADSGSGSGSGSNSNNKRYRPAQAAPKQPKQNTAVYVTGLPADATVDEVAELFSRKCGVIAEEIDSGRPRIKLYTDADGQFKGDALIVFFKPQSVDMAIMLLDDTDFRFGVTTEPRMRVQAADVSYKKTNYQGAEAENNSEGGSTSTGAGTGTAPTPMAADGGDAAAAGTGDGQPKAEKGKGGGSGSNKQDKQKIIKKTQKLDAKLADWSDDERPFGGRNPKWDKIVMLKHMFTLAELAEDPAALLDIKEDIREECAKLGDVTNVVLFDLEPEGVVSVKFRTAGAAAACVQLMDGRAFAGQTVEASLATGREKYKKSKKNGQADDESEDEADDW